MRTVIDVIEHSLQEPLGPDLIQRASELSASDLVQLLADYNEAAKEFRPPSIDRGEFWPYNQWLLTPASDPKANQIALSRAMSQLLFAHGVLVEDSLGDLLVTVLTPNYNSGPIQWRHESYKRQLANYLARLSLLRPLIEGGLVILVPKPASVLPQEPGDQYTYTTAHQIWDFGGTPLAVETIFGREVRERFERDLGQGGNIIMPEDAVPQHGYQELDWFWLGIRYNLLLGKVALSLGGSFGDLCLESPSELKAFENLAALGQFEPDVGTSDAKSPILLDRFVTPFIEDVEPHDVASMHQGDAWLDYRLALRSGLDRLSRPQANEREERRHLREEFSAIERAAQRTLTRSKFVSDRRRAGREVAIGAVVAMGAAPVVGVVPAASSFGVGAARTGGALLWTWMNARREEPNQAAIRTFSAVTQEWG